MKCFGTGPCVATMVRFSRCLYAQLMQQKFHAPKVFSKVRLHIWMGGQACHSRCCDSALSILWG